MAHLVSVDIDLHRCHCWDDTEEEVVCIDAGFLANILTLCAGKDEYTVLVECGSTHTYGDRLLKKKQAWLIYNSMIVSKLDHILKSFSNVTMLVSPSSTWTHGYNEAKRHMLADAYDIESFTKDQNHNIKECMAMAWFFKANPKDWVPLDEFIKCL